MSEIIVEFMRGNWYYCGIESIKTMKLILEEDNGSEENEERTVNFAPPEGDYRVMFSHFKEVKGSKSKITKIRVFWDILFPNDSDYRYLIWKDYPLENGAVSRLKRDLRKIFGKDLSEFNDESGTFDTDKLLGKEAEAKVGKKITNEYSEPLTVVQRLYPVGKFKFDNLLPPLSP